MIEQNHYYVIYDGVMMGGCWIDGGMVEWWDGKYRIMRVSDK